MVVLRDGGQCSDVSWSMKPRAHLSDASSCLSHELHERYQCRPLTAGLTTVLGRLQGRAEPSKRPGADLGGKVDQTLERVSLARKSVSDWTREWCACVLSPVGLLVAQCDTPAAE